MFSKLSLYSRSLATIRGYIAGWVPLCKDMFSLFKVLMVSLLFKELRELDCCPVYLRHIKLGRRPKPLAMSLLFKALVMSLLKQHITDCLLVSQCLLLHRHRLRVELIHRFS